MTFEIGLSTPSVPNRGFTLWIWSVIMVILAGIFVIARLLIRFHNRRLGADDWTILVSLISSILLSVTECSAVHYGYGKHSHDLDQPHRVTALKWFFGAQIMYKVVIGISKVSFLCLYLRIFIQPYFRRMCYGGIIFVLAWTLAYILVTIFQCKPIAFFWDKTIENPTCVDSKSQWLSYAVINILSDVSILALPIYPIYSLRLPRAKKVALGGPIPATIWSVIEANTGIICACLPVYKQPLQYFLPGLFGGSQQTSDVSSGIRPHRKRTPVNGSHENLQDPKDSAWRELHGSGGSFSNKVSTKGFEMYRFQAGRKQITREMDVKIT
ncbi:hypothetical protein FE257_006782 [Aspergillus nanangensis]|uniref:Rhodopsin domain-containing protein n=1 Tax=Aspergillus nanangensis TaxID=2582783 RepID=A0AAD4CNR2_ASPNN|nr:hypothetical protein FE257_006782 [Aspergillus nanangensis]